VTTTYFVLPQNSINPLPKEIGFFIKNSEFWYLWIREVEFSKHALTRMESRGISKEIALQVVNYPDSVLIQDESTTVYCKLVEENTKPYLCRVFVNSIKNPLLIITAYKTSKTEKYGS